ncbi:hypothetical protein WKI13_21240 [Teredinibacter turnerae]|uniref:hypothetical protein n=1 Tax=Teredinibacter turnerae TaxID=2426 RepID=UPI00035EF845|nr:hypothetical protein [Teredinibacter turnerae]
MIRLFLVIVLALSAILISADIIPAGATLAAGCEFVASAELDDDSADFDALAHKVATVSPRARPGAMEARLPSGVAGFNCDHQLIRAPPPSLT